MIYGYARCSTNESKQDIDRQVRELKTAGAESVFLEYAHGDAVVKHQLSSLLEQAQAGDTIITLEISRLARSTKQLCDIIEVVKNKRLRLCVVGSINVDCSSGEIDPMTNDFIQMSGVFAELELRIIRERVRSGMANARAKGAKSGRPQTTLENVPASFLRHYPAFKSGQLNLSEFARVCDLSRTTIYKYVGLLEGYASSLLHSSIGGTIKMEQKYHDFYRGEIYFACLEPVFGHEQGGTRPVLILQNDVGNYYSPTLIVTAATSTKHKKAALPNWQERSKHQVQL